MFPRLILEVAVVNPVLLPLLVIPLGSMTLVTFSVAAWLWRQDQGPAQSEIPLRNPVEILPALRFGVLLMIIILLGEALLAWLGEIGVYLLAAVSGSFDVDAVTLSVARMANDGIAPTTATSAIVIASMVNTLVKGTLVAVIARGTVGRKVLITLLVVALIGGLAAWRPF
jgi:uncharacterized membrane protein (DUF4010 family)